MELEQIFHGKAIYPHPPFHTVVPERQWRFTVFCIFSCSFFYETNIELVPIGPGHCIHKTFVGCKHMTAGQKLARGSVMYLRHSLCMSEFRLSSGLSQGC
eukprot:7045239-Ditylum_brightwellii.AAC.1